MVLKKYYFILSWKAVAVKTVGKGGINYCFLLFDFRLLLKILADAQALGTFLTTTKHTKYILCIEPFTKDSQSVILTSKRPF